MMIIKTGEKKTQVFSTEHGRDRAFYLEKYVNYTCTTIKLKLNSNSYLNNILGFNFQKVIHNKSITPQC